LKTSSPREHAFSILHQVETEGAYSDKLLQVLHQRAALSARECAFVNQLVKGVLEKRATLDRHLNLVVTKGVASLPTRIQTILRLGSYQLLELDNVSRSRAVSDSVTLAKKFGHEGTARLVNAVLRKIAASSKESAEQGTEASEQVPDWIHDRIANQWGEERCRPLLAAFDAPLPLSFRVNTLRATITEVQRSLAAEGWETRQSTIYGGALIVTTRSGDKKLHELSAFERGLIFVQDEASTAVVPLLNPQPGELIVDLCAAPGGKTTMIAELSRDAASVIAVDPSSRKLCALRANCERLGISSVSPIGADGRSFSLSRPADRVLVDAPCSGLGALGKKKDLRWNQTEEKLSELIPLQLSLLRSALKLVKPGGLVVFSTCSIDKAENEEVIARVIDEGVAHLSPIPSPLQVGELVCNGSAIRLWPDLHGSTGSFACCLIRI